MAHQTSRRGVLIQIESAALLGGVFPSSAATTNLHDFLILEGHFTRLAQRTRQEETQR